MSKAVVSRDELVALATRIVVEELERLQRLDRSVAIGVSNRHVHLCRADMDVLFGPGSELTCKKELAQPGEFAAEETVTLRGPKGELKRVRVLGPLRAASQVEISVTDGYALGVKAPVRESGNIEGTPGIELVGPQGTARLQKGVIAALRHIHMTPEEAEKLGLKDRQFTQVEVTGLRGAVLQNVLVRVSDRFALEMHVDMDEANALGVSNGDLVYIRFSDSRPEAQ